jgi:NAD/NADP transhydrogenase alpha subunit
MSNHEAPRVEPEWVQRMRAKGYNIRIGSGEGTLNEIPDEMFDPPASRLSRIRGKILMAFRNLFRLPPLTGRTTHAPLP